MKQSHQDAAFLREYAEFTSNGPIAIADALFEALSRAHAADDFERVAHIQIGLHAEMVRSLETIGALLLAVTRWKDPGGIMTVLFEYRPGDVPTFMRKLSLCIDPLRLLCFPLPDALSRVAKDPDIEKDYCNVELKKIIVDISETYLSDNVRGAYNKIKHAGMYVRHPEMLKKPVKGKVVEGTKTYVMLYREENHSVDFTAFHVSGEAGLHMAEKYHRIIRTVAARSSVIAGFVAFCLENDLMRRE